MLEELLSEAIVEDGESVPENTPEPTAEVSDEAQDEATIAPLVQVLEYLLQKVETLEKVVMEDIIGGITSIYDDNLHIQKKNDVIGKYGEKFKPYETALKELYPEDDLYENLLGELEEMRKGEGYTDEMGDAKVSEIEAALKNKFSKVKDSIEPKGTAIEVAISKEPIEGDDLDKQIKKLRNSPRMPR